MTTRQPARDTAPVAYAERLTVPLRWWVQTTMLLASVWLACIVAMPAWAAWSITGGFTALAIVLLVRYGALRVQVTATELRAGRAHIDRRFLGEVAPLDREETRERLGIGADARAFLVIRPYVHRSVLVRIDDPTDPTPYWLIGTRHPDRLAEALRQAGR